MSLLMVGLVSFSNQKFVESAISSKYSGTFLGNGHSAHKISGLKIINIFALHYSRNVFVKFTCLPDQKWLLESNGRFFAFNNLVSKIIMSTEYDEK